jgi:cytochrome c biogenesis protein CcmG/thiol:disulfide interchange protein DsbE
MEQNKWVDDRLEKLDPEGEWKPEVNVALSRFEGRRGERRIGAWPRAISVAAVAAICIVTFPQPRAFAQRIIAPCVEACQNLVLGSPLDAHVSMNRLFWGIHNLLGIAPADFAATDADGVEFRLSDHMGKVVLLNFWATWCRPCKEEIPWLVELQRDYGSMGLAVIGVSMDDGGWKAVRPFIAAEKINYRVAIGDSALAKEYGGVESLPQSLLISRKGGVLLKHTGITSKAQYEREIVRALWSELSQTERDRLRAEGL